MGRPAFPAPKIHDHAQANYVGRPFPLEEADEHWARLKSWGLTFGTLLIWRHYTIAELCSYS